MKTELKKVSTSFHRKLSKLNMLEFSVASNHCQCKPMEQGQGSFRFIPEMKLEWHASLISYQSLSSHGWSPGRPVPVKSKRPPAMKTTTTLVS